MDPELDRVYRATRYRVAGPGGDFFLIVDQPSAALAELHAAAGVAGSVYLTAYNPASRILPDAENVSRNQVLGQRLRAGQWRYCAGSTVDPAGRWPAEACFLVLGMAPAEGLALGAEFGQNAILVAEGEATPRLAWCAPAATDPGSSAGSDRPAGPGTGPSGN